MTHLETKIKEYREYAAMISELTDLRDAIGAEIKQAMTVLGQEKMTVGEYKITYAETVRRDVDSKRLAAEKPDIYEAYVKVTSFRSLRVS